MLFAIQQLAGYLFGYVTLPGQSLATFDPVQVGSSTLQPSSVLLFVMTVVVFTGGGAGDPVHPHRAGCCARSATAPHAASLLGLPVNRIRLIAFLVSGSARRGHRDPVRAEGRRRVAVGPGVDAVSGFLAMVVGGTGSLWAPLLGGLLLGGLEVFVPVLLRRPVARVRACCWSPCVFFAFKPQGLFVRTGAGMNASRRGLSGPALLGVAGAVVMLLWVGGDGYKQTLVTTTATYALVALGMYVPYLMAGSLSMAYGAYAGIGGYAVGLLSNRTELPLWLAWIVGPIVAAILAVLLGLVTRRLSGFFLAAVTLLFGLAFSAWLVDAEGISGGSGGLGNLRALNLLGWEPSPYQVVVGSAVLRVRGGVPARPVAAVAVGRGRADHARRAARRSRPPGCGCRC